MASSLLHLPLSPSLLRAWWFEDEDFKKRDKHITFEQDLQFWDIAFIASLLRDFVCQLFWACGIGFLLYGMMLLIWCCWLRASLVLSGVYKPTNLFLKQKADNEYMSFSPSHSWISELINQFLLFFFINIYIYIYPGFHLGWPLASLNLNEWAGNTLSSQPLKKLR